MELVGDPIAGRDTDEEVFGEFIERVILI